MKYPKGIASSGQRAILGAPRAFHSQPSAIVFALAATIAITGCATKSYVRKQTAPMIDRTNDLNERTAANNRTIRDTDDRAQSGIGRAQGSADSASANAHKAHKNAGEALAAANDAVHRANSLASVVAGLDNYQAIGDISVTFGFNKALLSAEDKAQLDDFAATLASTRSYILEVTGGTDSIGSADYNYALSERRADAVVQYLASKYQIPAHRFYLIGIGKDKQVADNTTAQGRAQNRRVQIRLLSNLSPDSSLKGGF